MACDGHGFVQQQDQRGRLAGKVPVDAEKDVDRPTGLVRRLGTVAPDPVVHVPAVEQIQNRFAPVGVGNDKVGPVLAAVGEPDPHGLVVLRKDLLDSLAVVHLAAQFLVPPLDGAGEFQGAADGPLHGVRAPVGVLGQADVCGAGKPKPVVGWQTVPSSRFSVLSWRSA